MAVQLLRFRKAAGTGSYRLVVWLDDTRTVGSDPDPAWLRRFTFGPPPAGMTEAAYLTAVKREVKQLVQDELARIADTEGAPLPGEGQAL